MPTNHTLLWPSDTLAAFEWRPPTDEQRPRYEAIASAYKGVLSMICDYGVLVRAVSNLEGVPEEDARATREALLDFRPRIDAATKAFAEVVMVQAWNEDARAAVRSISLCRNALNESVTLLYAADPAANLFVACSHLIYSQLLLAKFQANRAIALWPA